MGDRDGQRRVYLYFQFRQGWHCQFLETDLKTYLPRKLNLATSWRSPGRWPVGWQDQAIRELWNQNEPRISVSLLLRNLENSLYLSPL